MPLASGTRFGPYEIAEPIGAGGMGEVYRARDTTLERDVAIKVLPESFSADESRVARFEQEAKTLASLSHAHIAQIHGLERADGATAIVMELVEGPTLADRIAQGPVPSDEALGIAMQVADALEAAHVRGIVHRDLKPVNVKLRGDGTVKVLDFGIAKTFDPGADGQQQTPSLTTPAQTQAGVLLGTAAYMAPEQARGRPIDQRADIWAFGCLLYEMLTGQPAFTAEDVPLTLARVLADDTDLDSMPGTISPAVRQTIRLCLEKDAARRLADIRDVKLALQGAFETLPGRAEAREAPRPAWRRLWPHAASLAVGALVVGLIATQLGSAPEQRPLDRFELTLPEGRTLGATGWQVIAISPDGRRIVYNTDDGLYLRSMDRLEAQRMPGTEASVNPFFSPDGESVGYFADGQLKRVPVSGGGAPVAIASGLTYPQGASWEADGTILLGQPQGIVRVPAEGGEPELVVAAEDGELFYGPELLPDGDSVLFSVAETTDWDTSRIVVESLTTGERTVLVSGGRDARYLPSGHLVYALGDDLLAAAFDASSLTMTSGREAVVQGLTRASVGATATANYGVADDGTLAYLSGEVDDTYLGRTLTWVDRTGAGEPLGMEPCGCVDLAISPDGAHVGITILSEGDSDIWTWSFEARNRRRLTSAEGAQGFPVWSRDSERVVYAEPGAGRLSERAADGTGTAERLLQTESFVASRSLSRDDELIYGASPPSGGVEISRLDLAGERAPEVLLANEYLEERAALSPDGRWLAYESNETGRTEIYLRRYPEVEDDKWTISSNGGTQPVWAPDGTALYYLGPTHLMEARIDADPTFRRQSPEPVLEAERFIRRDQGLGGARTYDVAADGERFLVLRPGSNENETSRPRFTVVQNWIDELERRLPTE